MKGISFHRVKRNLIKLSSQIYFKILGSEVSCNICGYRANKMESDGWHLYTGCYNCHSGVRHRLLWACLNDAKLGYNQYIVGKKVLHFAPDQPLQKKIQYMAKAYFTADFDSDHYGYSKIDYMIDMSNMPSVMDNSFDCVIACDVLEHIKDDTKALSEVFRILGKNSVCFFTIPQKDGLKITEEDLSTLTPEERERRFGIKDHWRIYGDSFLEQMNQVGFETTVIDSSYFPTAYVRKHVLYPEVLSNRVIATNNRRIYIGLKK